MHPIWSDYLQKFPDTPSSPTLASGLLNLDAFGLLSIQGNAATDFLQGYITCDANKLNSEQALYGAMCDIKGRTLANFYLLQVAQNPCLLLHKSVIPIVSTHLKKYLMFSKCELKDISDELVLLGSINREVAVNKTDEEAIKHLSFTHFSSHSTVNISATPSRTLFICEPEQAIKIWAAEATHLPAQTWQP